MTVAIGILIVLVVDLISNDYNLFSRTLSVPIPEEIHVESKFMRVKHSHTTPDEKYYRAAYIDYLENRGVNDLCRFYQYAPATSAINSSDKKKPDKGEVYLDTKESGNVQLIRRDLNGLTIHAEIQTPTSVMINMNYYPGWKTEEGFAVQSKDGLIEVPLRQGDYTLTLQYSPKILYFL